MIALLASAVATGYLPGALLFRLPILDRPRRAALDPAERAFWAIVISAMLTLSVSFCLAAFGHYRWRYVLSADLILAAVVAASGRRRLLYDGTARANAWVLAPAGLIALALWVFPQPSEYIIGGKDPGVYMNAGVQIAQRGSLVIHDAAVSSLPTQARDLFFPQHDGRPYYSNRFMGFFLFDPDSGLVIDQFPHLYPTAIAIGYGMAGLTGARYAATACAVVGVLALYFLGARLVGNAAGAAAAGLLAIHVVQVWHARIPNSEVLAQGLLLAGLLALARAHQDDDVFFAPVAGLLLGLLMFTRLDGVFAVGLASVGLALHWSVGGRVRIAFVATLTVALVLFAAYLLIWLAPYAQKPQVWVAVNWMPLTLVAVFALALLVVAGRLRHNERVTAGIRRWLPHAVTAIVVGLAAYAWFVRTAGGRLALHDAESLRMFGWYVHPAAIAAALAGLALVAPRVFWRDPGFFLVACGTAIFVFHRIRIVPEHFWATRRFVPVILPAVLLGIAMTLSSPLAPARLNADARAIRAARYILRLAVLALVAWGFWNVTARVRPHVEYAGVIPRLEALAARFTVQDLIVVESRSASDMHVLALPLAYIYNRTVLVLSSRKPDKAAWLAFLKWAWAHYRAVYFVGGVGTDVLSRDVAGTSAVSERFLVPQYDSPMNAYPERVRLKEFDFGVYRLVPRSPALPVIDIGEGDGLNVVRFHAAERDARGTYRWTRALSYLILIGVPADARQLVLWMDNGGRPASLQPAQVEAFFGDISLGRVVVGPGMRPYTLPIPAEVASAAASSPDAATVRLHTVTWRPRAVLGATDQRELGVMVSRVEIRRPP
ncbi:MAG: glycosyltransferase family 39 protein [Vicinamibacteria bacterium]|nr:glycosyltransferase family 39 protein [Vicinamibacteria bacterium]